MCSLFSKVFFLFPQVSWSSTCLDILMWVAANFCILIRLIFIFRRFIARRQQNLEDVDSNISTICALCYRCLLSHQFFEQYVVNTSQVKWFELHVVKRHASVLLKWFNSFVLNQWKIAQNGIKCRTQMCFWLNYVIR